MRHLTDCKSILLVIKMFRSVQILNLVFALLLTLTSSCGDDEDRPGVVRVSVFDILDNSRIADAQVSIRKESGQDILAARMEGSQYIIEEVPSGNYQLTVSQPQYEENSPRTITVASNTVFEIDIYLSPLQPELSISKSSLDFGISEAPQAFQVRNTGKGVLNWEIIENQAWISTNPSSGTLLENDEGGISVIVSVSRQTLAEGTHSHGLLVSSARGGFATVDITLEVSSKIEALPQNLTLDANQSSDSFTLKNISGGSINYFISSNQEWLSTSPDIGSVTTETDIITVNVDKSFLSAGQHTGQVFINSDQGSASVTVTVTAN